MEKADWKQWEKIMDWLEPKRVASNGILGALYYIHEGDESELFYALYGEHSPRASAVSLFGEAMRRKPDG